MADLHSFSEESFFERIFKFSSVGMTLVSPTGKILKANQSFLKMVGYSESEMTGLFFQDFTYPEDRQEFHLKIQTLLEGSETIQLEKRYVHKRGHIVWGLLTASLFCDANGVPLFIASQIQDITEIKRTQQNLHNHAKMVALGEMSAGIAHEINNPLTIIGLHASVLEEMVKSPDLDRENMEKFCSKIGETVKRISSIVNSLKKFSHSSHSPDTFEIVPVENIIEDALGLCKEKFKSNGVQLKLDTEQDIQIECHPIDISQVILNLLNNSFHAIRGEKTREIEIQVKCLKNHAELSITDSGPGVPENIRARIMEPFFTTKPLGEGSGLGLPISHNIIKYHHGEFYLDANSTRTRFVIRLPIRQKSKSSSFEIKRLLESLPM